MSTHAVEYQPLWMAYGGPFRLTPDSLPAPIPRLLKFKLEPLEFPHAYVDVELTVILPLGPETVGL